MPWGKSTVGTHSSSKEKEAGSSHGKSLASQNFTFQIFRDRRENVPVGRSHPERPANSTSLSQDVYLFLKNEMKTTNQQEWDDHRFPLGEAEGWFSPHDGRQKKHKLFPLGFEPRTSRVLGECDDHYTTETHVSCRFKIFLCCYWGRSWGFTYLRCRIEQ